MICLIFLWPLDLKVWYFVMFYLNLLKYLNEIRYVRKILSWSAYVPSFMRSPDQTLLNFTIMAYKKFCMRIYRCHQPFPILSVPSLISTNWKLICTQIKSERRVLWENIKFLSSVVHISELLEDLSKIVKSVQSVPS